MKTFGNRKTAFLACIWTVWAAAAFGATETFEKAYSLDGVSRVRLENVNGAVRVLTWDRNYIRVTAVKTGSPATLEHTQIRATQPGDEIRIETISTRRHHFFFFFFDSERVAKVEYELLIPSATTLKVSTVNGTIRVAGRSGDTTAEAVNGRLDIADARGQIKAETVNGRIYVSFAGESRDARLETVNGSIDAEYPAGASLRYSLSTVNGAMEVGDRQSRAHALGVKSFEGEVNGGRALFKASTVNGAIHVSFSGHSAETESTEIPAHDDHVEKPPAEARE
jgi:hypothetical protein